MKQVLLFSFYSQETEAQRVSGGYRRPLRRWGCSQVFDDLPAMGPPWCWRGQGSDDGDTLLACFTRLFSILSFQGFFLLLGENIVQIRSFSASVPARELIFYLLYSSHWNIAVFFSGKSSLKDTLLPRWSPHISLGPVTLCLSPSHLCRWWILLSATAHSLSQESNIPCPATAYISVWMPISHPHPVRCVIRDSLHLARLLHKWIL